MTLKEQTIANRIQFIGPDSSRKIDFKELWDNIDLLYFLTIRNVKARYRQTILGILWVIIQPVFTVMVLTLFFGKMIGYENSIGSYSIFVFAALIPWLFFAQGFQKGSTSLVGQANLIKKVYFPRLFIPLSEILACLPDLCIGLIVYLALSLFQGFNFTYTLILLPIALIHLTIVCSGVCFWFSAINVVFRDIQHTIGFITQIWMFATPIIYPITLVNETWRLAFCLNPLVGAVELFRLSLTGGTLLSAFMLSSSIMVGYLITISGLLFFKRIEHLFADKI